jgi:hypothetical protein
MCYYVCIQLTRARHLAEKHGCQEQPGQFDDHRWPVTLPSPTKNGEHLYVYLHTRKLLDEKGNENVLKLCDI